jgi:DNA-binding transcriptional regulator YdaS (Cro superfamily)
MGSNTEPKSAELLAAEKAGQEALNEYCRRELGIQAELRRNTGIFASDLSRMCRGRKAISFENAVLLDLATNGELPAEVLCPSRAKLIQRLFLTRAARVGATQKAA